MASGLLMSCHFLIHMYIIAFLIHHYTSCVTPYGFEAVFCLSVRRCGSPSSSPPGLCWMSPPRPLVSSVLLLYPALLLSKRCNWPLGWGSKTAYANPLAHRSKTSLLYNGYEYMIILVNIYNVYAVRILRINHFTVYCLLLLYVPTLY